MPIKEFHLPDQHEQDDHGNWADGSSLKLQDAPPKDKPVVLVFGGSFNPMTMGHVAAAKEAKRLMREAGYNVRNVILSPVADKLLAKKTPVGALPLADRVELGRISVQNLPDFIVTGEAGREQEAFEGKLRRTQLADWAQRRNPDATVVNVTGEDQANGPGHNPPGFPSLYAGTKGSNHEGYYYLALPRPDGESSISSTKVRDAIKEGKPIPEGFVHPDTEAILRTKKFHMPGEHDQLDHGNWAHGDVTESESFKKWFGDSKVVDADGKPLVVYHGTTSDVPSFDVNKLGSNSDHPSALLGFYFATDHRLANSFADIKKEGGNVLPVYLSVKNPYVMTAKDFEEQLDFWRGTKGGKFGNGPDYDRSADHFVEQQEWLRQHGHDGILIKGDYNTHYPELDHDQWIVFEPEQIKSRFNRGTFDLNNPKLIYHYPGGQDHDQETHGNWANGPRGGMREVSDAPVGLDLLNNPHSKDTLNAIYGRTGELTDHDTLSELKIYPLQPLIEDRSKTNEMLSELGLKVEYFAFHNDPESGVKFRVPNLKTKGYDKGYLWIYDPRVAHGSFEDTEYTRSWRLFHEAGHAVSEELIGAKYGPSKREGRLGQEMTGVRGNPAKGTVPVTLRPLTLLEAQRAIEWEDTAFRTQRLLLDSKGVRISDGDFNKEYNVNITDAVYRVMTGDFGDPGKYGYKPSSTRTDVKSLLRLLENQEKQIAASQGRNPTRGIDLDTWEPVSTSDLQKAIENRKLRTRSTYERRQGQRTATRAERRRAERRDAKTALHAGQEASRSVSLALGYEPSPFPRPLSKYESRVNYAKADEAFKRLISDTNGKLRGSLRKTRGELVKRVTDTLKILNPSLAGNFKVDVGDEFYRIFRDFLLDAWRDGKDQAFEELPERVRAAARQVKQFHGDGSHDEKSHGNWATGESSTETEAFKAWFGKSVAVDNDGKPKVFYHGTNQRREVFEGSFFTDSKGMASAYAEMKALQLAVEENDELSEIVGDILAEEGGESITDLGPDKIKEIAEANGIEIKADAGYVHEAYLKVENPLDLREYGSDVGDVEELWGALHEAGLLDEKWSDIDEEFQQEIIDKYDRQAIYRLLEEEGVQAKAFDKGYDAVIFTDMAPDGGASHTSWLVKDGSQIKSKNNRGTFDPSDRRIDYHYPGGEDHDQSTHGNWASGKDEGGFYSPLGRALDNAKQNSAPAQDWIAIISKAQGVTKDELAATGILDYLKAKGSEKVTKDELLAFAKEHAVTITPIYLGAHAPQVGDRIGVAGGYDPIVKIENGEVTTAGGRVLSIEDAADVIMLQSPKFSQYTLPGGENYREMLLTLPSKADIEIVPHPEHADHWAIKRNGEYVMASNGGISGWSRKEDAELYGVPYHTTDFQSGHFSQPNIVAHLRMNERVDADGNKILFLEEIQSDWAQQGRSKGFTPTDAERLQASNEIKALRAEQQKFAPGSDEWNALDDKIPPLARIAGGNGNIPPAPFVTDTKSWVELSMKHAIAEAVKVGATGIAWTTGEQQADRYDLSKQVDSVRADKGAAGISLTVTDKSGRNLIDSEFFGPSDHRKLADTIGKELADKIIKQTEPSTSYTGIDLKVGGEGMKSFYDSIVPNVAGKLIRKSDPEAKIAKLKLVFDDLSDISAWQGGKFLGDDKRDQQGFYITPKMREMIRKGIALFELDDDARVYHGDGSHDEKDHGNWATGDVTETESFKKWFGDSKAKTRNGKPIVFYHGTLANIEQFDPSATGKNSTVLGSYPVQRAGFFFARDPKFANEFVQPSGIDFVGGNVMPVYLRATKPLDLRNGDVSDTLWNALEKEGYNPGYLAKLQTWEMWEAFDVENGGREFVAALKKLGYDSVRLTEEKADKKATESWVVFDPEQIKSKFNKGTFDPADKRISYHLPDGHDQESHGNWAHGDVTESKSFKKWFSGSKVVDEDGNPKVLYHGTFKNFDAFAIGDIGYHFGTAAAANQRVADLRHSRLTTDASAPNSEDAPQIIPVYLSIKNPLRLPDAGDWDNPDQVAASVSEVIYSDGDSGVWPLGEEYKQIKLEDYERALEINKDKPGSDFVSIFKTLGYDGVVYKNAQEDEGVDSWIAFDSEQIKSKFNTKFDPKDKRFEKKRTYFGRSKPEEMPIEWSKPRSYAGFEPRQAIDYLTTKALVIKGLLDNELTEDVRQLLLEHLKGGRTIAETIMDLREMFEPWIGDPEKIAPSGQVGINTPPGTKSQENVLQAYRLENMIRTPLIEAYNQGRLAIGDASDDYVIGYQYSAILDSRTTEICEQNDGLTIRADDPRLRRLSPPVHFQCRSILVYVTIDDAPIDWSSDEELDDAVSRIQEGFS